MALEALIAAWSKDRPAWQREVMRRVAAGHLLSGQDYDQLVEAIVAGKQPTEPAFGLAQFAQTTAHDSPVRLVSIHKHEHVNALESTVPLTFEPNGFTVIYGDNGSGKSGYARLLKRIARARANEEVLSDVFRNTALAAPTALLYVRVGDEEAPLNWPEAIRPELKRMLFYDAACGHAYIATESDFPYRPSALFVMDGLIEACVEVRARIDAKLVEIGSADSSLPIVTDDLRDTPIGTFLAHLSGSTSIAALDELIKTLSASGETL
jgi:energy-coupling factor transporter ATP-binding protein EcfA2